MTVALRIVGGAAPASCRTGVRAQSGNDSAAGKALPGFCSHGVRSQALAHAVQ